MDNMVRDNELSELFARLNEIRDFIMRMVEEHYNTVEVDRFLQTMGTREP